MDKVLNPETNKYISISGNVFKSLLKNKLYIFDGTKLVKNKSTNSTESNNPTAESNNLIAESNNPTAESNNLIAESNNPTAESNNLTAESDNLTAESNNLTAESDNLTAGSNNLTAESDNLTAGSDNLTAGSNNLTAGSNNLTAESDNLTAGSNNPAAESNNPTAKSNNPAAESNNPTAKSNNLTAESDNLPAEFNNLPAESNNLTVELHSDKIYALIKEYNAIDYDEIYKLHMQVNNESMESYGVIRIKYVEYMNVFIYDTYSKLDIDAVVNILNGDNMSGKTSIANIIKFGLFGKISGDLMYKTNILNITCDSGYIRIALIINDQDAMITRTISMSTSGEEIIKSEYVNINSALLDNKLFKLFESFNNINSSILINGTHTEKIDIIHSICNTDKYEKYCTYYKKQRTVLSNDLLILQNKIHDINIDIATDIDAKIDAYNIVIDDTKCDISEVQNVIIKHNTVLSELNDKLNKYKNYKKHSVELFNTPYPNEKYQTEYNMDINNIDTDINNIDDIIDINVLISYKHKLININNSGDVSRVDIPSSDIMNYIDELLSNLGQCENKLKIITNDIRKLDYTGKLDDNDIMKTNLDEISELESQKLNLNVIPNKYIFSDNDKSFFAAYKKKFSNININQSDLLHILGNLVSIDTIHYKIEKSIITDKIMPVINNMDLLRDTERYNNLTEMSKKNAEINKLIEENNTIKIQNATIDNDIKWRKYCNLQFDLNTIKKNINEYNTLLYQYKLIIQSAINKCLHSDSVFIKHAQETALNEVNKLTTEINELIIIIKSTENNLKQLNEKLYSAMNALAVLSNVKQCDRTELTKLIDETTRKIHILSEYIRIFSKKELPMKLNNEIIAHFVNNINKIFSSFVSYTLSFDMTTLNFSIHKQGINKSLICNRLSGYESLILQISINCVYNTLLTNNHKFNIFIIDEGFDKVDRYKTQDTLPKLLKLIKSYFNTILCITHKTLATF
jgi:DNA repair exonuclease SbcCD ATPase subunit